MLSLKFRVPGLLTGSVRATALDNNPLHQALCLSESIGQREKQGGYSVMCDQNCEWLLGMMGWLAFFVVFLALLLFSLCLSLIVMYREKRLDRIRRQQLLAFRLQYSNGHGSQHHTAVAPATSPDDAAIGLPIEGPRAVAALEVRHGTP